MKQTLVRTLSVGLALSTLAISSWSAPAAAEGPALTSQQQRMSACSRANKGKKGDDFKASQKACLSGAPAAAPSAPMTQKEKMTACSKANKGKKGDDYKASQKACLSA